MPVRLVSAVALTARAEHLLARPAGPGQVVELQLLLTQLSGIALRLETEQRRFRRRIETATADDEAVLQRRVNRVSMRLAEIDAMREPLRRRRAALGA